MALVATKKARRAGMVGVGANRLSESDAYRRNTRVHQFAGKEPTPELPKLSWGPGTLTKAEYDAWWEEYEARQG